ncbi:MAG TPA: transposase [bacterium]|nr:transposase [bacterium]
MVNNPEKRRRSIRLTGYDYSDPGSYLITICTYGRECAFGEVSPGGSITLNPSGRIVFEEWRRSAAVREEIGLDAFVVMPNHVHGIVVIKHDIYGNDVGATGQSPLQRPNYRPRGPARFSLASYIVGYKGAVTRRINAQRKTPGAPVWQRNYYERVLRNDDELNRARFYIQENPARWVDDDYNPVRKAENVTAIVDVIR